MKKTVISASSQAFFSYSLLPTPYSLFTLLLATLLLATLFPVPLLAQEPDYDRINEVASQMNCPTCVGINLADCRTQTCAQWRDQISDLIAEGYSDQEVLDYFEARYGTQVLLEPPKSGLTLALWILPVVVLIMGGGWLFYTMRSWNRTASNPAAQSASVSQVDLPPTAAVSPDYLSQVEKDLEN